LVRGHGGAFEITMGDELIFSKKKEGRFPQPGEIERELAARMSA
jgi:selT/selW/selH-like putative selenoprotein